MKTDQQLLDAYLAHLAVKREDIKIDLPTLTKLQATHLTKVPFENLDVYGGKVPPCDAKLSVEKILNNRGGWCFENNAAFAWLLQSLGFDTYCFGASVLLHGPCTTLNHLCVQVVIDDVPYLVDVGFGDSFTRPLRLLAGAGVQTDPMGEFEIVRGEGRQFTLYKFEMGERKPCYRFARVPRNVEDFTEVTKLIAVDPNKPFKAMPFATRLLDGGPNRVTILKDKIKFRRDGVWEEQPVAESEWQNKLFEWFSFRTE